MYDEDLIMFLGWCWSIWEEDRE